MDYGNNNTKKKKKNKDYCRWHGKMKEENQLK